MGHRSSCALYAIGVAGIRKSNYVARSKYWKYPRNWGIAFPLFQFTLGLQVDLTQSVQRLLLRMLPELTLRRLQQTFGNAV